MDFTIGNGFSVEGQQATIDLAQQSDDVVKAAYEEARAVGEKRGLWVSGGVGTLAVASEVDVPESLRGQLLATVGRTAELYISAIDGINVKRNKKDRIPTLQTGEYRERAEDWLTDNLVTAATHLPTGNNRPRLIVPRLNRSITREENVEAWKAAAGGNLWSWSDRMKFLQNWSQDQLSGFDPETDPETTQFQIIPTVYDENREGTVSEQKDRLKTLRTKVPELHVAAIFDGVILGRRYMGQTRRWQDSYVRQIDLEPAPVGRSGYVPRASVDGRGDAFVSVSHVRNDFAARLLAR